MPTNFDTDTFPKAVASLLRLNRVQIVPVSTLATS